ncbi:hypothetical protein QC762_0059390 [Podospora pseudocomata]|uniref:Uncharacterized protein n=1 Tax=Podospora pseudocomata TaxID=2093779 RepID=A0ABR0GKQ9_9PEZI|nr:hypothetical protein QC762_0059390 [Podospora pseudocomata]
MLKHLWFAGAEPPWTDFHIANETRLLPRNEDDSPIKWADWKALARELLQVHERDPDVVHPRFLRAELRLSRINTIHRFTRLPPFHPYVRDWHSYSSLFHDNLAWMATAAVFLALVLTAMQVGLATERLQQDTTFQQASYGFTVFAILGPICAFGLVALGTLFNLVNDLLLLIGRRRNRAVHETSGEVSHSSTIGPEVILFRSSCLNKPLVILRAGLNTSAEAYT